MFYTLLRLKQTNIAINIHNPYKSLYLSRIRELKNIELMRNREDIATYVAFGNRHMIAGA